MAEIFVSYRRDDTGMLCERVTSRLAARFGPRSVFRDTNAIYVGSSWEQTLRSALQDCYVVVALIGPEWLSARDAQGRPRLFDPRDFVRMELATALAQGKRIIPVLATGARMPLPHELPPDLAPLASLAPFALRPDPAFDADMQVILQTIAPGVRRRIPHLDVAICGVVGLAIFALYAINASAFTGLAALDYLVVPGQLALLLGCALIITESGETRDWGWLIPAVILTPPQIFTVFVMAEPFFGLDVPSNGALELLTFFTPILVSALTLGFGFFGPRSLTRARTDQERLRQARWIVASCAVVVSVLLVAIVIGLYVLGLDVPVIVFTIADFFCINGALLGAALALGSSLKRRHWWRSAGLAVAALALLISFLVDQMAPPALAGPALYGSVALTILAMDAFALARDPARASKR